MTITPLLDKIELKHILNDKWVFYLYLFTLFTKALH